MKVFSKNSTVWVGKSLLAFAIGALGGAVFYLLHVPLPWTLGSLTFAAVLAITGVNIALPAFFRNFSRPTVGVMAGSAFTLPVVMGMGGWWPVMLLLLGFYLVMTVLGRIYFTRVCKQDVATAVFAAMPGGLSELTLLGGELGGNMRFLVSVHTFRVVASVVALPFIVRLIADPEMAAVAATAGIGSTVPLSVQEWALLIGSGVIGFAIGSRFRKFGGIMLGPLLVSAIVHVTGLAHMGPPAWLVIVMQIVIGSIVGSRFSGITPQELRTTAFFSLLWAAIMLTMAFLAASLATLVLDVSLPALVLAFSPGGFAEMTILAYAIGIEVAFVVTCHAFRATSVLLLAPATLTVINHIAGPRPAGKQISAPNKDNDPWEG